MKPHHVTSKVSQTFLSLVLQLVYERIPRGDLVQRVIHLRVLDDGAFWENTLLGEAFIPLKKLVPGQHWVDWHKLGGAGAESAH